MTGVGSQISKRAPMLRSGLAAAEGTVESSPSHEIAQLAHSSSSSLTSLGSRTDGRVRGRDPAANLRWRPWAVPANVSRFEIQDLGHRCRPVDSRDSLTGIGV